MSKTCRICNQTKEEIEFDKNRKVCKKCKSKQSYETFKKDKNQIIRKLEKAKNKRLKNPEIHREYNRKRIQKLKETNINHLRNIRAKAQRNYRKKNKEKQNEYERNLYKNNINFHIASLVRKRIGGLIRGFKKSSSLKLLGCSIQELKNHLQQTAISNGYTDFDINKYSGKDYHIDHIVPCSSFNLKCSFHQNLCFNWSNLQILKAEENLIKGDQSPFII